MDIFPLAPNEKHTKRIKNFWFFIYNFFVCIAGCVLVPDLNFFSKLCYINYLIKIIDY